MSGGISEDFTQLEQDLLQYADEAWSKKDIVAGLKLLATIAGVGGTIAAGVTVVSSGIPFVQAIGIPITFRMVAKLVQYAVKGYDNLDSDSRALVRKTVRFLGGNYNYKSGIDLVNHVKKMHEQKY